VQALRERGNRIKQQVAVLEEEEKALEHQLREQLLALPNLPAAEVPEGRSEADNVEVKRWGSPSPGGETLEEHWQIGERLGLLGNRALGAHRPEPLHHPAGRRRPPGAGPDQLHARPAHRGKGYPKCCRRSW
jgi:hypothetical protein